jgi:hypothetical protein
MRRFIAPVLACALAVGSFAAAPAAQQQAADHNVELQVDESATVDGGAPGGINLSNQTEQSCSKGPADYCETILVKLTNPYEEENAKKGRERATAVFTLTTPDVLVSDYDLFLYESDEAGAKGSEIGTAGEFPLLIQDSTETATVSITTTQDVQEVWVLVEVSYFAAAAPYAMDISFA